MEKIKKLNIKDLLQNDTYLIPLYQRNYAWEREEIQQLLKDICESIGNYYLGTLVVSKNTKNQFEIIDGQQRHTTLSIINAVLKYYGLDAVKTRNLYFEARVKSENIIDNLLLNKESYLKTKRSSNDDKGILNILNAVQDIEDFLDEKFKTESALKDFISRFYNEIILFRAELPDNTDLNHYFEIMNNRGEQLEEHEIIKASFMNKQEVETDEKQILFSKIWDACSQMNCHVQMSFSIEDRTLLFGEFYQDIPNLKTLNDYIQNKGSENVSLGNDNNENEKNKAKNDINSLLSIIDDYALPTTFNQNKNEDFVEKFNSIIDFPNFLLQVLKLQTNKISLDDKALLSNFGYPNNLPDAWEFIANLLRYRVLFDRYVVKREGDSNVWSWTMKTVIKNPEYQITFSDDSDKDFRRKIRMIQSMFQVTFPSNNYKNWLFDILIFFKEFDKNQLTSHAFLLRLENYANNYFAENSIASFYNNGLQTPRFLFNYLDYILWVEYYDKVRGKADLIIDEDSLYLIKIQRQKEKFASFKFVQRSSIEHLFPQSRYKEINNENEEDKKKIIDSFGNLCLISRNSNSAYNNDLPFQKKHDSKNKNESLKQLVMFAGFDGENWNTKEIIEHHKEMEKLLSK